MWNCYFWLRLTGRFHLSDLSGAVFFFSIGCPPTFTKASIVLVLVGFLLKVCRRWTKKSLDASIQSGFKPNRHACSYYTSQNAALQIIFLKYFENKKKIDQQFTSSRIRTLIESLIFMRLVLEIVYWVGVFFCHILILKTVFFPSQSNLNVQFSLEINCL